jgi:hypothetical protein
MSLFGGLLGGLFGNDSAPPPAPDYAGMAKEQGAANLQAAKQTAALSNPNIVSPWSKQTVTYNTQYAKPEPVKPVMGGTQMTRQQAQDYVTNQMGIRAGYAGQRDRWGNTIGSYDQSVNDVLSGKVKGAGSYIDQAAYDKAMKQYEKDYADYQASAMTTPTVEQGFGSPEQEAAWKSQQIANQRLAELGVNSIGRVEDVMSKPFQYTGRGIQTSLGNTGQIGSVNMQQYGQAGGGPDVGQYGMQQGGVQGPTFKSDLGLLNKVNQNYINFIPNTGSVNRTAFGMPNFQTKLGNSGDISQINTSDLAAMPINAGTSAQQAIMSRLQPQINQQRSQLQTQLANQGITPGSAAYENAMNEQMRSENDLLSQAALQGLNLDMTARQQGLGEAQTVAGFANQAQQQAFNQALASGQFGNEAQQAKLNAAIQNQQAQNAAQQQAFNQALNSYGANVQSQQAQNAAQQQAFNQALESGQFGNQAQQAAFEARLQNQQAANQASAANFAQAQAAQQMQNAAIGQNQQTALAQMQANNAAQNQIYNQLLQSAQFKNTADEQNFQRQLGLYNLPLNQVSALMSGSQVGVPQFQGYQGAGVTAAPIFQAGQAQNQYNMDVYNANVAQNNATMGALGSLGSAGIMAL